MEAPAAIAITISAVWNSLNGVVISDDVIPAAVIIATVEEPCKIRTVTAAKKAKSNRLKQYLKNNWQAFHQFLW